VAQEWAIAAAKKRDPKDVEVPAEYQRHEVVFSKTAAHRFPPSHPEDHAIQLKPDAPDTIKCKTYPLTRPEMEVAKKFLDENQAMGYIEPTNSPYSSPFFFIKKKDGCHGSKGLWLEVSLNVTCSAQVLSFGTSRRWWCTRGVRLSWIKDEVKTKALNVTLYSLNTTTPRGLCLLCHTVKGLV
jgi:hypothetical protein